MIQRKSSSLYTELSNNNKTETSIHTYKVTEELL